MGVNKGVDHANGVILDNPVFKAFRQQCRLSAIDSLNKARHHQPAPIQIRLILARTTFLHSLSPKQIF